MEIITQNDINTLTQHQKDLYIEAEVLTNNFEVVKNIEGSIISGNYSIDADSDVRRTCNILIQLDKCDMDFTEEIFFQYYLKVYIGYYSFSAKERLYYCIGIYCFDQNSTQYDESNNTLSLSMVDMMCMLDNEHRGTLYGALTPIIYACDPETGERKNHNDLILRNIVVGLIKDFGINDYIVDDIGNYTHDNTDIAEWNELPYDLEFQTGCGLLEVLTTIRDLYSFYEMFFDVDGVFHFQKIPTLEDDMYVLDENIFNPLVISENSNINIYDVKNIIDLWGKDLDADRFAENDGITNVISYTNNVYYVTLDDFKESDYVDGLLVGLKIPSGNTGETTYININHIGNKIVKDSLTGKNIQLNTLSKDTVYIFKYKTSINGFYLLGNYQIHAVSVLTNGSMKDGCYSNIFERKEYFKKEFNTNAVRFVIEPENPYCIEKIGWLVYSISNNDYGNIDSNSTALSSAEYELWKKSRRTDSITLETILIPWLDVNQKIKYTKQNESDAKQYIVKSINADFDSCTMTVELVRFYDLFMSTNKNYHKYTGNEEYLEANNYMQF